MFIVSKAKHFEGKLHLGYTEKRGKLVFTLREGPIRAMYKNWCQLGEN